MGSGTETGAMGVEIETELGSGIEQSYGME